MSVIQSHFIEIYRQPNMTEVMRWLQSIQGQVPPQFNEYLVNYLHTNLDGISEADAFQQLFAGVDDVGLINWFVQVYYPRVFNTVQWVWMNTNLNHYLDSMTQYLLTLQAYPDKFNAAAAHVIEMLDMNRPGWVEEGDQPLVTLMIGLAKPDYSARMWQYRISTDFEAWLNEVYQIIANQEEPLRTQGIQNFSAWFEENLPPGALDTLSQGARNNFVKIFMPQLLEDIGLDLIDRGQVDLTMTKKKGMTTGLILLVTISFFGLLAIRKK